MRLRVLRKLQSDGLAEASARLRAMAGVIECSLADSDTGFGISLILHTTNDGADLEFIIVVL